MRYLEENFDLKPRFISEVGQGADRQKRDISEYEAIDENLPNLDVITIEVGLIYKYVY